MEYLMCNQNIRNHHHYNKMVEKLEGVPSLTLASKLNLSDRFVFPRLQASLTNTNKTVFYIFYYCTMASSRHKMCFILSPEDVGYEYFHRASFRSIHLVKLKCPRSCDQFAWPISISISQARE